MKHASPIVAKQYAAYVYPLPVDDLEVYTKEGKYDLSDPSLFRRKLWPRKVEPEALDILIAGCGTIQAATYAYKNPNCRVLGVDISEPSLAHQQFLKEKHNLKNLELRLMSLGDIAELERDFDLIVSTGVLHHLPDPDAGLRCLKQVLRPHGVMSIMVYGYWRRVGVYMMQEAFRLMGLEQNDADVEVVKTTVKSLPPGHSTRLYADTASDLHYNAGFVDTFLHKQDRAYTVPQVLEFARSNGLQFRTWLDTANYSIAQTVPFGHPVRSRGLKLPPEKQWALVELLTQALGCHRFLLCHPEAPATDYTPDFTGEAFLRYVPCLRPPVEVVEPVNPATGTSGKLKRAGWTFEVSPLDSHFLSQVNGTRTIAEIVASFPESELSPEQVRERARDFYSRMWSGDHLMFELL